MSRGFDASDTGANRTMAANRAWPWVRLLRPLQWSKNAVVFAALVFGQPGWPEGLVATIGAFVAFCAIASATYLTNDIVDRDRDRHHPRKRTRPIAAGQIAPRAAAILAALLSIGSLALGWLIEPWLVVVLAGYALLMLTYSLRLKHIVLLDVFVIAAGFLLRAVAGAVAVQVPVSTWLLLCTMLLALFLGFGKRRHELMMLQDAAGDHRATLRGYTGPFLDLCIAITAAVTIMAYSFYTFSSISVPSSGAMMATVPFVVFAVLRYLYLMYVRHEGGSPEVLLWRDMPLLGAIVCWGATVIIVLAFA